MDSEEQKYNGHRTESLIFQVPQKRRLIFCLLLALTTLALYNPVTHAPFLNYDDVVYVTDNPQVRAGLTWPPSFGPFTPQNHRTGIRSHGFRMLSTARFSA